MFAFNFETYNDQEVAEANATGLNDVKGLREKWDTDLTPIEIDIERENVIVFDKLSWKPLLKMLSNISKNYEGDEKNFYQ